MPTIRFSLNEEHLEQLEQMAKDDGGTVQDYIRNRLFNVSTIFTPSEAVNRALKKYSSGETFTLPQLYGDDWTIERGVAGVFGKRFFNHVESECSEKIIFDKMVESGRRAQYKII